MRWPHLVVAALVFWVVVDMVVGRVPGWAEAVAGLGLVIVLGWASLDMRSQGFVAATTSAPTGRRRVALTFDDGPDPSTTPGVLETLERHGARATFFVLGHKAEAHAELLRRIHDADHDIGSHAYTHRWWSLVTGGGALRSLQRAQQSIEAATGVTSMLFRPPYGVTTPALGRAVRKLGLTAIGWSIRTRDGRGYGDVEAMVRRTLAGARDGDIILLHDAPEKPGGRMPLGPDMLDTLLQGLREQGLEPVVLSELLSDNLAAEPVGNAA